MCNSQAISFRFEIITHILSSPPGLLTYEYLITFDREVKLFWKRAITGSSILFIVNRYLPLVCIALGMPSSDPTTNKVSVPLSTCFYLVRSRNACIEGYVHADNFIGPQPFTHLSRQLRSVLLYVRDS